MVEIMFDNVADSIKQYSKNNIKPLADCKETINLYEEERYQNNEYRKLADKIEEYKKENEKYEESSCWFFYKYLESLDNQKQYQFPLKNGEYVTAEVDLLNPYESILKEKEIVNPQWHLIVAFYAYKDAAYNHQDNEYARKIRELDNGLNKNLNRNFNSNSLKKWMEESISINSLG